MIGDYCYQTGKARLTEATAKAILDCGIYRSEEGHPRDYYWCEACESIHLTSQTGHRYFSDDGTMMTQGRYYRKKKRLPRFKHVLTGD